MGKHLTQAIPTPYLNLQNYLIWDLGITSIKLTLGEVYRGEGKANQEMEVANLVRTAA